jgi:Spy/CpxP family protein refolding chaperone
MKKLLLPVLAMAFAFTASSQEIPERKADHPPMMHHKQKGGPDHRMAMKELNLTDAQKEQFKTEKEAFHKKMEAHKKNENITVKEWKAKRESLVKEHKAKMESVFTPEQKAKLEKLKKDGEAKHEEMMKQRGERMKTHLGLTDEQSAKLDKSRKEMGDKMKAIRENKSLTEEQKRTQMKELGQKQKENLKSILTEEQLKKFKEERRQGPGRGEGEGPGRGPKGPKGHKMPPPPPPPPVEKQTL